MNYLNRLAADLAGIRQPANDYVEQRHQIEGNRPHGFVVAIDLGRHADYTAIVIDELHVAERVWYARTQFDPVLHPIRRKPVMRHQFSQIHRYQIGTSYPDIARSVQGVLQQLPARERRPELVIDATGVGVAVVDIMGGIGLSPFCVTITGGQNEASVTGRSASVPKSVLASSLDAALAEDRVDFTTQAGASAALRAELQAFRIKQRPSGSVAFEAHRASDHDDIVLAVTLAIWRGDNLPQPARWKYFDFMSR